MAESRSSKGRAPNAASTFVSATPYVRDRKRLVDLLSEIVVRLGEPTDPRTFPPVLGLVREIDELELCERLGFRRAFVVIDSSCPPNITGSSYACSDPTGDGGAIVPFHRLATVAGTSEIVWNLHQVDVDRGVEAMALVANRYLRAIDSMEEPKTYPAPVPTSPSDPEEVLVRDTLWRCLLRGITELDQPDAVTRCWALEGWRPWMRKLSTLVDYEYPGQPMFFAVRTQYGRQTGLIVRMLGRSESTVLPFLDGGVLGVAGVAAFRAHLVACREIRAQDLRRGSAEPTKKSGRRRGRRVASDPKQDASIAELRRSQGMSVVEIARQKGSTPQDIRRAMDRHRQREKRRR